MAAHDSGVKYGMAGVMAPVTSPHGSVAHAKSPESESQAPAAREATTAATATPAPMSTAPVHLHAKSAFMLDSKASTACAVGGRHVAAPSRRRMRRSIDTGAARPGGWNQPRTAPFWAVLPDVAPSSRRPRFASCCMAAMQVRGSARRRAHPGEPVAPVVLRGTRWCAAV